MPIGGFLNAIPPAVFLAIHLAAFGIGAYLANRAFKARSAGVGWGFTLYALAEVMYMTYHLDWTVFLFAHTIAEVLNLVAFGTIFTAVAAAGYKAVVGAAGRGD